MSASIYWQPQGKGKYVGGGSTFWKNLCEAVDQDGVSELSLDESDLSRLHSFRAGLAADDRQQVTHLIEAIQSCGVIRVWVTY